MFKADAYHTLRLQYGAPAGEVTRAWKQMVLECHPDKNGNSVESNEHTQRLNAAKDMLLTRDTLESLLETDQPRRQRPKEELERRVPELLECRWKWNTYRLLIKQQEQELERKWRAEDKAKRAEARRAKAQTTKRETCRRKVIMMTGT